MKKIQKPSSTNHKLDEQNKLVQDFRRLLNNDLPKDKSKDSDYQEQHSDSVFFFFDKSDAFASFLAGAQKFK